MGRQLKSFRQALLKSQLTSVPVRLTATVHSEHGIYRNAFDIISRTAENKLNSQLSAVDDDLADPGLRLVSKGELLLEARVYPDAALAFERALALDPSSQSLLTAATIANDRTGNLLRADELRRRMRQALP